MPKKSRPVATRSYTRFVNVVRRLRRECPWDRAQTHATLRSPLIEEAYEAVEAITRRDVPHLREELGDLLLHIILHSVIAEEAGEFTLDEVIAGITAKMIRRHPHVFGTSKAKTEGEVLKSWERMKLSEGRRSVLQGVPTSLPALLRAKRLQERASNVGFDWKRRKDVWAKVQEELGELTEALKERSKAKRDEEFGDLLFSLVNYARFLNINPEHALNRSSTKFIRRFQGVERALTKRGSTPADSTLEEMDALWNAMKRSRR